eukprot:TRINITY_DN1456_c1_g3_i1.p1 TRINITY_DN1456_c1_g3~~TRINITY_DN1456_c1_g3_i1.p1  ORF type:complete len:485 (-),score=93.12 TRINITY_DN1456_c1_g3_i1:856-2196(-)
MTTNGLITFVKQYPYYRRRLASQPDGPVESSPDSLSFNLQGRDDCIESIASMFEEMYNRQANRVRYRYRIPVCTGISGIGKTRLLEEWMVLLDKSRINSWTHKRKMGVIISYGNGQSAEDIEMKYNLPMEVSFSWRLLYQLYIKQITYPLSLSLDEWFKLLLRSNAASELTLQLVLETIISIEESSQREPFVLVIGVDEFQPLTKLGQQPTVYDRIVNSGSSSSGISSGSSRRKLFSKLISIFDSIISYPVDGIIILPLLAGTNYECIPSEVATEYCQNVPMTPLKLSQVETSIVKTIQNRCNVLLLSSSYERRNLFYFGGIPSYLNEYCRGVIKDTEGLQDGGERSKTKMLKKKKIPTEEILENNFGLVRQKIRDKLSNITERDLLILVAASIAGIDVHSSSWDKSTLELIFAIRMTITRHTYHTRSSCVVPIYKKTSYSSSILQ